MSELKSTQVQDVAARVRAVATEVVQGSPHFVVDVQVRGNKGSRVVEVFVDSDEGIDVGELARISREVGFLLDTEEIIAGRYSLNVSSPGIDRPLTEPRQFRKNVGRRLKVKRRLETDGTSVEEGDLVAVTDDGIALAVTPSNRLSIPFTDVIEARVLLPW